MNQKSDIDALISNVLKCACEVRKYLLPGYLEKVYENALVLELRKAGLEVKRQHRLPVTYKEELIGNYIADVIVNDSLIVEVKAVSNILLEHELQVVSYLTATGIDDGLIVNFGNPDKLESKRKFREYKPRKKR